MRLSWEIFDEKKGYTVKKAIVSMILLAAVLFCIGNYFYHAVPMQFEIEGAVKIKIFSGADGKSLEAADPDVIAHITENITSLEFTRGTKEKTDGYTYTVWWFDAYGNKITCLHLMADDSVIKNDRHYTVESGGKIDLSYIDALFSQTE